MASTRQRGARHIGLFRDQDGRQRSAGTYDTPEEALARAQVAELDASPPQDVLALPRDRRGRPTLAGFFPGWLKDHRLEPTSRVSYEAIGKHIVRELGTMCVSDLDEKTCARFFRKLESSGLSSATIGNARTVLRGMCRAAVREGLLDAVPEMSIAPIRNREMTIATREQARVIGEHVPEHYRLLVETLFATGLRYGEAMGLGPEHVGLNDTHAVLKVGRRVVTEVGGKPIVKTYGKTPGARRDVVIPRDLGERLLAGARNGYLFRAPRGKYPNRATFRRTWLPAVRAAGVPALRVHDARHSHASWLANDPRVPLAAVRDRLGHSNLKVTSRYIHSNTPPDAILAALGRAA